MRFTDILYTTLAMGAMTTALPAAPDNDYALLVARDVEDLAARDVNAPVLLVARDPAGISGFLRTKSGPLLDRPLVKPDGLARTPSMPNPGTTSKPKIDPATAPRLGPANNPPDNFKAVPFDLMTGKQQLNNMQGHAYDLLRGNAFFKGTKY